MDKVIKFDLENMLDVFDSYVKQWRFDVHEVDRKVSHVSPFRFDTEESALRAALVYTKQWLPRGEACITTVSHE